jgi:hypothetical protein
MFVAQLIGSYFRDCFLVQKKHKLDDQPSLLSFETGQRISLEFMPSNEHCHGKQSQLRFVAEEIAVRKLAESRVNRRRHFG